MKVIFLDFDGVINTINPKMGFGIKLPLFNDKMNYHIFHIVTLMYYLFFIN